MLIELRSMCQTFVLALSRLCRFAPDGPRHKARRPLGLAERCSDVLKKVQRRVQKKKTG
jgi:hypothetical protein